MTPLAIVHCASRLLSYVRLFFTGLFCIGLTISAVAGADAQPIPSGGVTTPEKVPVKVGLVLPLTGARASIGEDALQGAQLAVSDLVESGKIAPKSLELAVEDSQGDPAKGVSAYKKLVRDGVKLIITQNSNVSLAVAPLVDADGVLQLAITTTSERYSRPNDNTYRTNGPTKPEADLIVATLQERLPKEATVAVITMQDEYPATLQRHVLEGLAKTGFKVTTEDFVPQENDYRAIISRITSKGAAAVVFLGYQTQGGTFVKQLKELGGKASLVVCNTPINNREFFDAAGSAAEGVFVSYPLPDLSHPAAIRFRERYGKQPNFFSANAYDGVMIAFSGLSDCRFAADPACVKRSFDALKDFSGMSGRKGFDGTYGDMQDSYHLLVAHDGAFMPPGKRSSLSR